jgi:glycerol-3-phosphate acyltransferase PlsY
MNWIQILSLGFLAYLLGSIPTAVWIGKWFYKKDIRNLGSGNAGFSNALRVFGPKAGIPVLIVDVGKGFAAVSLANILNLDNHSFAGQLIPVIYGLLAFVGHLIPIFAGFKGGKGVATGLGIILALFPLGALYGLGVYILAILLFRMMSVGSMLACISLPISAYLEMKFENPVLIVFTIFITVMIIFTHRSNIKRILSGTENRIWFRKKSREN